MNTDTPRTDDKESRIQCDLSSMKLDDWNAAYHEMKEHAQKLERELTAVTEQRDRLAEALRKIKNAAGTYDDPYDEFDFIDWVTFEALQFLDQPNNA